MKYIIPILSLFGIAFSLSGQVALTAINSQSYIDSGFDASNLKIAVIDNGFGIDPSPGQSLNARLVQLQNAGALPTNLIDTVNLENNAPFFSGDDTHGASCVEALFDHASGADYYLYRINFEDGNDFNDAVNAAIANGVDVLSISIGPHNEGWNDNSGLYCQGVEAACQSGMLVFIAAGNETSRHWQGNFLTTDGDAYHEWDNNGNESNNINVPNGTSITLSMQWDGPESFQYYDIELYDSQNNELTTTVDNDVLYLRERWTNNIGSLQTVSMRVVSLDNVRPEIEIFLRPNSIPPNFSIPTAENSIESPGNATHPNALTISQADPDNYNDSIGATPILDGSSRGPTNDGALGIDLASLCGSPTMADTTRTQFSGTSCAAPNAAGATAVFWSAFPAYSATGVRQVIKRLALLYKDWGDAGPDTEYGSGGIFLRDYTPNTVYILKGSNNSGNNTRPYQSMEQADAIAPTSSNAYFLGGTYNAPPAGTIIDKPMIYRSVQKSAIIR